MEGYIGQVLLFAGHRIPNNWMTCDGQVLPVRNHEALFSILGTTYGGDTINFNLPKIESVGEVKHIICVEGIYPDFW